jgi:hypothetical protein
MSATERGYVSAHPTRMDYPPAWLAHGRIERSTRHAGTSVLWPHEGKLTCVQESEDGAPLQMCSGGRGRRHSTASG